MFQVHSKTIYQDWSQTHDCSNWRLQLCRFLRNRWQYRQGWEYNGVVIICWCNSWLVLRCRGWTLFICSWIVCIVAFCSIFIFLGFVFGIRSIPLFWTVLSRCLPGIGFSSHGHLGRTDAEEPYFLCFCGRTHSSIPHMEMCVQLWLWTCLIIYVSWVIDLLQGILWRCDRQVCFWGCWLVGCYPLYNF